MHLLLKGSLLLEHRSSVNAGFTSSCEGSLTRRCLKIDFSVEIVSLLLLEFTSSASIMTSL